jgi:four helix bundle protein
LEGEKMLRNYKELKVWKKAYALCLQIYEVTKDYPREEKFGLSSQMRRAGVSVPSNIAEGYGRKSTKQYIQQLYVSYGSICEMETQLLLSKDLYYLKEDKFQEINTVISEVERMLKALIRSLEKIQSNRGDL